MAVEFDEDVSHNGKVRASFGSSAEFVHFWGPTAFGEAGDIGWIDEEGGCGVFVAVVLIAFGCSLGFGYRTVGVLDQAFQLDQSISIPHRFQSFVDHMRSTDAPNLGEHRLLLRCQHVLHLQILYSWQHAALHQRTTFVVLDVTHPDRSIETDLLRETLLLEVANGVVIGVREEVHHGRRRFHVILEMVHQMRTISFDLFRTCNGTENDFGKFALLERTIRDTTNHLQSTFDNGYTLMIAVKDKSRDVLAWHLWQLALEDVLEAREQDHGFVVVVVGNASELDEACTLFNDCWTFLLGCNTFFDC